MSLTPIKLTYAEFCALPETVQPHELINGELRMPAAPNRKHQMVLGNLYALLRTYVRERNLGWVYFAPIDVVLDRDRPLVLQPDLLFVSRERAHLLGERIFGAPDLVVEIFSPGGATFDRTEKAAWYAQYGVREYWLVDPEAETVEVRRLEPGGYELLGVYRRGDTLRSALLSEFALPISEVFVE